MNNRVEKYFFIVNPMDGYYVPIYSKTGQKVLNKFYKTYLNQVGGKWSWPWQRKQKKNVAQTKQDLEGYDNESIKKLNPSLNELQNIVKDIEKKDVEEDKRRQELLTIVNNMFHKLKLEDMDDKNYEDVIKEMNHALEKEKMSDNEYREVVERLILLAKDHMDKLKKIYNESAPINSPLHKEATTNFLQKVKSIFGKKYPKYGEVLEEASKLTSEKTFKPYTAQSYDTHDETKGPEQYIQTSQQQPMPSGAAPITTPPAEKDVQADALVKQKEEELSAAIKKEQEDAAIVKQKQAELMEAKKKLSEPSSQQPAEQQPAEQQPAEQQPAEQQPAEQQPAEQQPAEQQPAEQQPAEQQPAEQQPAVQQPVVQQPAEVTPEPTKDEIEETKPKILRNFFRPLYQFGGRTKFVI